jgi:uncharacterized protein (DUF58 family)
LSRARELILKAKKSIFSDKIGNNPSIFKGEGYDFVELRDYQIGDDIRKIDWNITAKSGKPYVKLFQEERELNVVSVALLSGSVYFGSKRMKQDLIGEIVSILGLSAVKNMDIFSSFIFAENSFLYNKPSKRDFAVEKGVQDILTFDPVGKSIDTQFVLKTIMEKVKRKSLIFLISDFYHLPELKFLAKKSEVVAIIVRDRYEENPPSFGSATLVDSESGSRVYGNFGDGSKYHQQVIEHDKKLFAEFKKRGVRYIKIYTDQKPLRELRKFFG